MEVKELLQNIPLNQKVCYLGNQENPKKVYLLLHGFSLTGQFMIDFFKSILKDDELLIAPNAPFPAPVQTKSGYKEGYSWYFFDSKKSHYYIDYQSAYACLHSLLLDYKKVETTIIGYSQGGYLAPYFAAKYQEQLNIKQVITLGASRRVDYIPEKLDFDLYCINGSFDTIVEYKKALELLEPMLKRARRSKQVTIEQAHRLNPDYLNALKELL